MDNLAAKTLYILKRKVQRLSKTRIFEKYDIWKWVEYTKCCIVETGGFIISLMDIIIRYSLVNIERY